MDTTCRIYFLNNSTIDVYYGYIYHFYILYAKFKAKRK